MPKRKVLIVEDQLDIAGVIQSVLEMQEVDAIVTNSGKKAIEKMQKENYHAVILDVNLPDMDGLVLYRELLQLAPQLEGHFLFMSGIPPHDELKEVL